jgi:1L-myo-inositol 1-phosphate cytidylyltransferase / CDP-L-myo-inositol myo-inositolphosphotransferase
VDSLLLVIPGGAAGSVAPDTVVAGLPLLRRIVLAGQRAGFTRVVVQGDSSSFDRLLGGTVATALSSTARPLTASRCRIVILAANVVPQARWLRALRESEIETERLYADAGATAVIDTDEPSAVLAAAASSRSIGHLVEILRARFDWADLKADDAGRFPLATAADTGEAESWLLRSLIKQREGFMSRHFERRISLALTRRLAVTRITPDVMTLVSLAIGLAGAPFFLSASPAYQLTGALLFLLHSILDGCDGELARLKFMESPHGAILDFWGDNVVHVAVFACMSVGLSFAQQAAWPLALGTLTVASVLAAAAHESSHIMQDAVGAGWRARLAEAFSSRDFIYLIVAMSAFGKAHWFLIFASVGTPIFFLLLLSIGARRRA